MLYLKLFHGRRLPQEDVPDEGVTGPVFGPYPSYGVIYDCEIVFGESKQYSLNIHDGLVYYDGVYYGDHAVCPGPLSDEDRARWTPFSQSRAMVPSDTKCCCERPGYYYTGIPGVLARMVKGRLAEDASVERCDVCQRYDSDEAALHRLEELGLAEPVETAPPDREFTVICEVIVQTQFEGVQARDFEAAAGLVHDRFDWESVRDQARFRGKFSRLFVEGSGTIRNYPAAYFGSEASQGSDD